ncbi:hypothetical protein [Aeromicrobium sp. UC242_57]|uniref:hypothetical protein n=1 Tax=Aeromicrobium sp. UC242_57 TaxID=3374624 RepID=UPI0037A37816
MNEPTEPTTDATDESDQDPTDEGALEDQMSKQSFPTSDPPSTWAGDDEPASEE